MAPEILDILVKIGWAVIALITLILWWRFVYQLFTSSVNWISRHSRWYKRQMAEHQKALDLQARVHEQQRSTSIRIANLREQYNALGPDADEKRDM